MIHREDSTLQPSMAAAEGLSDPKSKKAKITYTAPKIIRVAIIGTAGRGKSLQGLDAAMYAKMVAHADKLIAEQTAGHVVHLLSGGAAWADHIAVTLFLSHRYPMLSLHLPCALAVDNGNYHYNDTGNSDFRMNPGRSSNKYHREFSAAISRNTIREIQEAAAEGAKLHIHKGFFARNDMVASQADLLIAFTWGQDPTR